MPSNFAIAQLDVSVDGANMTTKDQRVWIVTGAGRGIGASITVAALESGDIVVATDRNPEGLSDR